MAGIDNNTVLYLRGDSFNDLSLNPKTITNNGVSIDNNCFKFGASKRLVIDSNDVFAFGTSDFTVEMEVFLTNYSESDLFVSNNNYKDFYFNINPSGKLRFDTTVTTQYSTSTILLNTWSNVCISRKDGTVYMFINGKLQNNALNNGNITMTSPRIGYHDAYTSDKIEGNIRNIRVSNIARYTEDYVPKTSYNSLTINVTNQTNTNIDFNISKLGRETINKVEVLQNNIVKETYTDNFDNLTYNIDSSLCVIGNNKITIRVTYDDNYVEEEVLTHTVTVNNLPTSSSLKDVIDRQELLNNSIEVQKNNLKNILISKNVEVSEEENKLSSLIDKVNELGDAPLPPLYLYKEGDECIDVTGGWKGALTYSNSYWAGGQGIGTFNDSYVKLKTNASRSLKRMATVNKIDVSKYNTLYVELNQKTSTSSYGGTQLLVLKYLSEQTNWTTASVKATATGVKGVYSIDLSNLNSSYYIGVSATVDYSGLVEADIYKIWLEN